MNKTMLRVLTFICAMLMLVGTVGLVACNFGDGTGTTEGDGTTEGTPSGGDETTPGGNSGNEDETTPGGSASTEPKDPTEGAEWLKNFDEKLAALANHYGRNMSVAWGGNSEKFASGSEKAIKSAIDMGADAIGIYVKATSDNVLVAIPATNLYDCTNFKELKGKDGLPTSQGVSAWTWEQVQQLKLLKPDGTVSDQKVLTLSQVVVLCKDKCFVYIKNCEDFSDKKFEVIYQIAKETEAYSAFLVTPGVNNMTKWKKNHSDDTKLADFLTNKCEVFYHGKDYYDTRTVTYFGINEYTNRKDNEEGWEATYKKQNTFLTTEHLYDYVKWIAKNFRSSLEYTPDQFDNITYSINKENLTARYLLISDVHYTPVEDAGYKNRVTYRGYSTHERMTKMCQDIENEYNQRGLDAVFILGDLTTDDYPHRTSGVFLAELYQKYLTPLSQKLGIPILSLPGNHDGHPNALWKASTGTDRQYVWENPVTGDVFLMADTFDESLSVEGTTNKPGSGVSWINNKEEWIDEQLAQYADRKNVFVCSHKFSGDMTALINVIGKYDNVKALYDAHVHHYSVQDLKYTAPNGSTVSAGAVLINTGSFSYGDWGTQYGNDFDFHDYEDVWGYNIVETTKDKTITYRVDVEAYYAAKYASTGLLNVRDYRPYIMYGETELK